MSADLDVSRGLSNLVNRLRLTAKILVNVAPIIFFFRDAPEFKLPLVGALDSHEVFLGHVSDWVFLEGLNQQGLENLVVGYILLFYLKNALESFVKRNYLISVLAKLGQRQLIFDFIERFDIIPQQNVSLARPRHRVELIENVR